MILLLLVIVAQLTLALSSHPSLCLRHLVRIVRSGRKALVLVEALRVGSRVGAYAVVLADRVVALLAAVASVCVRQSVFCAVASAYWRTLLGVRAGAAHHGHRLAAVASLRRRWRVPAEWLPTLGEVLGGAFDFCGECVSQVRDPCQSPVTAMCVHCSQPQPNMVLTTPTSNSS